MDEIQQWLEVWSLARDTSAGQRAGHEAAKRLLREWAVRIRFLAPSIGPDEQQDCVQELVILAVCGRKGVPAALAPSGVSASGWRNVVLRNGVKDFLRRRARHRAVAVSVAEGRDPKQHARLQSLVRAAWEATKLGDHTVESPRTQRSSHDAPTRLGDVEDENREADFDGEVHEDALTLAESVEVASLRRDQLLGILDGLKSAPRAFYVALRLGFDTSPWQGRVAKEWGIPTDTLAARVAAFGGETDLTDHDLAGIRFGVATPSGVESEGKTARRGVHDVVTVLASRYGGEL